MLYTYKTSERPYQAARPTEYADWLGAGTPAQTGQAT